MNKVRLGVVGLGAMGKTHCRNIQAARSRDYCLAAVCTKGAAAARAGGEEFGVPHFADAQAMYDSGLADAVIIATPHYWHVPLAIRAARAGLHVMCEKPLSPTVGPARAMIAECKRRHVVLGAMLQHRTRPIMIKMKRLVDAGAIGEVFRVVLVCSNWFRTQAYYDSSAWRGTWDGEGGGVLINQAPHHLDLFQWIGGMPRRVMGMLDTRTHKIEVEDTANFLCDYGGGKVGYIYATTAELPGNEQFAVFGDEGVLIAEGGKLRLGRLPCSIKRFTRESEYSGAGQMKAKVRWLEPAIPKGRGGHIEVVRAFTACILRGTPMYASGEGGLNELELSNAMYLAGFGGKTVDLPVNADEIERLIARLERQRSTGKGANIRARANADLRRLLRRR